MNEYEKIIKIVVEKCGGMQVNDKKDVPVSADNVKNLNTERK